MTRKRWITTDVLSFVGIIIFIIPLVIVSVGMIRKYMGLARLQQDAIWISRYGANNDDELADLADVIDQNERWKIDKNKWEKCKDDKNFKFISTDIDGMYYIIRRDGYIINGNNKKRTTSTAQQVDSAEAATNG